MSITFDLNVSVRKGEGKGACKKLREEKLIPGIFYSADGKNIPVQIPNVPLEKLLEQTGTSVPFTLKIDDDGTVIEHLCFVREIQRNPVRPEIVHVDFFGVDPDAPQRVTIPVKLTGRSKGVVEGGKLKFIREQIMVEGLPKNLPGVYTIDITNMKMGDVFHVADLEMPEGVSTVYRDNYKVVTVEKPGGKKTDEEGEEAEAAAE